MAPSGPRMSFFVSSATSVTGNLGGLAGADATCQRLAAAAGQGARTWRAYLSVERDASNGNRPTNARDRIGAGPCTTRTSCWSLAAWPSCTHGPAMRRCSSTSVVSRINGQWTGLPAPVQHDILTGIERRRNADGRNDMHRLDVG